RDATGAWTRLAFVRDAEEGLLRFYSDGKLIREAKDEFSGAVFDTDGPWLVGAERGALGAFVGALDEVVITRKALRAFGEQSPAAAKDAAAEPPPYRPVEAKTETPDPRIAASWEEIDRAGVDIVPCPKSFKGAGRDVAVGKEWTVETRAEGLAAGVEQINRRLAELGAPALAAPKAGAAGHIVVGLFDRMAAELKRIGSPAKPPRQGYVIGFAWDGALPAVVVAGADLAGARYGCVTLARMLKSGPALAAASVQDWPDYAHRMGFTVRDYFTPETLPAAKRAVDDAFGAKINLMWGRGFYVPFETLFKNPELRRELNAYAAERNVRIVIGHSVHVGEAPFPKNMAGYGTQGYPYKPEEGLVGHRGRAYTWSRDDLLDARAEEFARLMRETGADTFYLHSMDTGGRDNPENWNLRTPMDHKRWGNDRGAADANIVNRFVAKLRAANPEATLFYVAYPYGSRYLAYPEVVEWLARLSALTPESVYFCVREGQRGDMEQWKDAARQGRFIYHQPTATDHGFLFHVAGRYARTFFFDDKDVYWLLTSAEPMWVGAEYAWNTQAPGWGFMPSQYMEPATADACPAVIAERLTPRVARVLYGEAAGADMAAALLSRLPARLAVTAKGLTGVEPEAFFREKTAAAKEALKRAEAAGPRVLPRAKEDYTRMLASIREARHVMEARYLYFRSRRELAAENTEAAQAAIAAARKALEPLGAKSLGVEAILKDLDVAADIKWRRERRQIVLDANKPGLRVGVYRRGGAFYQGVVESLSGLPGAQVGTFENPAARELAQYNVIIFPAGKDMWDMTEDWRVTVRAFVEKGGGVIFSHNSVGRYPTSAFGQPVFPEVCAGYAGRMEKEPLLTVAARHPSLGGLAAGAEFREAYTDHMWVNPGPKGTVLLKDKAGKAVAVAGEVGKGRVIYTGIIFGVTASNDLRESTGEMWKML
ncbi:MAG TPA: glycoside hydrolase family 20 zincin-like fold domain-containing protein, partial [Candidatus Brocadiia bacterium]|nr:glycoside hydrolase family 20 zincin-like fold domain-containing protein [Candidatus Brocadiia bacterium]